MLVDAAMIVGAIAEVARVKSASGPATEFRAIDALEKREAKSIIKG